MLDGSYRSHFFKGKTNMTSTHEQDDGKKIELHPSKLNIVWGKDSRYWRVPKNENDESCNYAELLQVCWLEVTGKLEGLAPKKKYSVGFTISFNQDTFGFDNLFLMAKVGKKGNNKWKKVPIDLSTRGTSTFDVPDQQSGHLTVETLADECDIQVGLYEVWSGRWKGGLKIHRAFAIPLAH